MKKISKIKQFFLTFSFVKWMRLKLIGLKNFYPCMRAYKRLVAIKGKEKSAVFNTSCAIGDLVYGMTYVEEWKKLHPDHKVIIIADPKKKDIINCYSGYDQVIYWGRDTRKGYDSLVLMARSKYFSWKGRKKNIFNIIPRHIYGDKTGKTCLELLRKYLDLSERAEIHFPVVPVSVEVSGLIPDFEKIKNKIVIINPYAHNKTDSFCAELLMHIVSRLKEIGYEVYSNIVGAQMPLEGTKPLNCSLAEFYYIADNIPLVISERSGIIDWVVSTKSRKLVLYSKRTNPVNTNDKEFRNMYTLYQWKPDNCEEVYLSEMSEKEARDKAFNFIGCSKYI